MRHIVTVNAKFIVDDSNFIDWQTPEGEIRAKIKTLGDVIYCKAESEKLLDDDNQITWQQVIEKYTKKDLFS